GGGGKRASARDEAGDPELAHGILLWREREGRPRGSHALPPGERSQPSASTTATATATTYATLIEMRATLTLRRGRACGGIVQPPRVRASSSSARSTARR